MNKIKKKMDQIKLKLKQKGYVLLNKTLPNNQQFFK